MFFYFNFRKAQLLKIINDFNAQIYESRHALLNPPRGGGGWAVGVGLGGNVWKIWIISQILRLLNI